MPPTIYTEGPRLTDWLKGETQDPTDFCRDSITIANGETLVTGTVLGKLESNGEYVGYDPDATDGGETVAGILISDYVEADTAAGVEAAALVRGHAVIIEEGLTWPVGISGGEITAALAALKALGILTREAA